MRFLNKLPVIILLIGLVILLIIIIWCDGLLLIGALKSKEWLIAWVIISLNCIFIGLIFGRKNL